ncbi:hypothetical protein J1N35_015588 [Gossypium stocksii]|uniref:Uncharacterized protein n=1 Tax=Gossypium stocksii TaxID=47602 RepID=A0A9D3VWL4_9ROSI|nr:hypothetical protein J1N35_015588 [Gossypium stocksii]
MKKGNTYFRAVNKAFFSLFLLFFWRQLWISGKVKGKTVEFFKRLYGEVAHVLRDTPNFSFPLLNSSEISLLEASVTDEEIKKAMFDMAPLKAPGSDGFHAHFFQSQWDIIGNDVCQWVKNIFDGRPIDQDLNNTLIVLVGPNYLPGPRPI